jgi:molybdate transport system substrate-binding protein
MRRFCRAALLLSVLFASANARAGELTVSAAASLTDAFKEMARQFSARTPGTTVALNFGASGALLQQLAKGAPVDVFATADQETMDSAQKQGLLQSASRRNFAANALVLVVPADSALKLAKLGDLALPAVTRVAIGAPASVPVGRYTKQALEAAQLWRALAPKMISTQSVRQSLDYVARGEVDAAFVYATDAALMPARVRQAFGVPLATRITYPVALVAGGSRPAEAQRFVDFVLSPQGQAILATFGFGKP